MKHYFVHFTDRRHTGKKNCLSTFEINVSCGSILIFFVTYTSAVWRPWVRSAKIPYVPPSLLSQIVLIDKEGSFLPVAFLLQKEQGNDTGGAPVTKLDSTCREFGVLDSLEDLRESKMKPDITQFKLRVIFCNWSVTPAPGHEAGRKGTLGSSITNNNAGQSPDWPGGVIRGISDIQPTEVSVSRHWLGVGFTLSLSDTIVTFLWEGKHDYPQGSKIGSFCHKNRKNITIKATIIVFTTGSVLCKMVRIKALTI